MNLPAVLNHNALLRLPVLGHLLVHLYEFMQLGRSVFELRNNVNSRWC